MAVNEPCTLNEARVRGFTWMFTLRCTGYCIGTENVETLVEDLACPVHGIAAQERASKLYPDRQEWLDALAVSR